MMIMKKRNYIIYTLLILFIFVLFYGILWFFLYEAKVLGNGKKEIIQFLYLILAYILGFIPLFGIGLSMAHALFSGHKPIFWVLAILLTVCIMFNVLDFILGDVQYVFQNGVLFELAAPLMDGHKWYEIFKPALRILCYITPLFLGMMLGEKKFKGLENKNQQD